MNIRAGALPGWPQSKNHRRQRRDHKREREYGKIERNPLEARDTPRRNLHKQVAHPKHEEETESAPEDCDDKTLGQKFANDLSTGRANRGVNGKLTRTRGPARGKQVRQVGAGNEQDEGDGAEKQREIRPILADEI